MTCTLVLTGFFVSCDKNGNGGGSATTDTVFNAYLLNEGSWGSNNASLSLFDTAGGNIQNDYFALKNGRGLGDQAQDIMIYGSKMYVTVTESKTLWVINPATGVAVKQLSVSGKPRSLACAEGKVFVSCYDKTVVRVDTAQLSIDKICHLSGMQPEQMAVLGSRLYVTSTWQQSSGGEFLYDSTLSVVDLNSFTEVGKITVGPDPVKIKALDANRLVVLYGNGYNAGDGAVIVTPSTTITGSVVTPLPIALGNIDVYNGDIYGYTSVYNNSGHQSSTFYRINGNTLQATEILTGYLSDLQDAYGINIDGHGNLYICTSYYGNNSNIICFNSALTKRWSAEAGVFASKAVFF